MNKMESFELLQTHLAICGIKISQKSSKNHPINVKNSTIFILVCAMVALHVISLKEADNFDECTDILFRCVSIGACNFLYVIVVLKTTKLFEFINRVADTVNESE